MAKAKTKTAFFCKECGYEAMKWLGQCPSCHQWNTIIEQVVSTGSKSNSAVVSGNMEPVCISDVKLDEQDRISTRIKEMDRVLGGGIVQGSLVLVGGDPGIGKSTLLLQMCKNLSVDNLSVLYISGEESLKQIKMRADRLGSFNDSMKLLCETNLTGISEVIRKAEPDVVIIDSVQTMFNEDITGSPGSISQVRESTSVLLQLAKSLKTAVFIVGHVTKDGMVAGPRMLEHMVDTVLYFEGDRHASYRILRAVKNRFGSTDEIGVFEMRENGLAEVDNPSEYMLQGRPCGAAGTVTTCAIEGTRPILIEVQALVSATTFPNPRRQAAGADYNRVNLLMAVLEKRMQMHMGNCDAYVNVAGGMKIAEPAIDLGIVVAIVSSYLNKPVSEKTMVIGEVGLSGEVRGVSMIEQRVNEAVKLGFTTILIPSASGDRINTLKDSTNSLGERVRIIKVESVKDAIEQANLC